MDSKTLWGRAVTAGVGQGMPPAKDPDRAAEVLRRSPVQAAWERLNFLGTRKFVLLEQMPVCLGGTEHPQTQPGCKAGISCLAPTNLPRGQGERCSCI